MLTIVRPRLPQPNGLVVGAGYQQVANEGNVVDPVRMTVEARLKHSFLVCHIPPGGVQGSRQLPHSGCTWTHPALTRTCRLTDESRDAVNMSL